MCINNRSRLFLVEPEAVEGVAETLVPGTDDIFAFHASGGISEGINVLDIDPASPSGNLAARIVGGITPQAVIQVPIYGKGKTTSVVNRPNWFRILQTVGHVDLSTGSGAELRWTPDLANPRSTDAAGVTTAALRTFTLWEFTGRSGSAAAGTKTLRAMRGCRLASMTVNLNAGETAMIEFTIVGRSVQTASSTVDISGANIDGVFSDFTTANASGAELVFSGPTARKVRASSTAFTFAFGMTHIMGDDDASGVVCVEGTEARLTGTVNPLIAAADIGAWASAVYGQSVLEYRMAANGIFPSGRTGGTGYGFRLSIPQLQILGDEAATESPKRRSLELQAIGGPINPMATITLL